MPAVKTRTVTRATTVLAALALLAAAAPTTAAAGPGPARVWFVGADGPVAVPRVTGSMAGTVRRLLAGPTGAERQRGLRSEIPSRTPLLDLTSRKRVVSVDLGTRFAAGKSLASFRLRADQLIRTLKGVPGVKAVRITIAGGTPIGLFPGYDLTRPVSQVLEQPPTRSPGTRELEQLLADLGYLARGAVGNSVDEATRSAVIAFQKWTGLPRDGVLGGGTVSSLLRAVRPEPFERAPGRRIEVDVSRQVALLIDDNRVVRTIHVSSGAGGATPVGSFEVYRKETYSWSVPFKTWLPWASYFTGGFAFHEYASVPTYAASHGCVRVSRPDAQMLYGFAQYGTPVHVFWEAT
jgi:peptidoglycan hydrolase-like protein with peptidoglycan-binding domain